MTEPVTIWDKLAECVSVMSEPFRASEIIGWFRRHYPEVNESSLRAHIQVATSNAPPQSRGAFANRRPLITRVGHGVYVRARPGEGAIGSHAGSWLRTVPPPVAPAPASSGQVADVLLVTCVKRKRSEPSAAKDLYVSPLFVRQRTYAETAGVPWYILSAEHGLVAPDEWLAPYERYLGDTPSTYRAAWGEWVTERLALLLGPLHGRTIEVHASEDYLATIRIPLRSHGAVVLEPLRGLAQGQRLAWYDSRMSRVQHEPASVDRASELLDDLVASLSNPGRAVRPVDLDLAGLDGPGLYSWWVDTAGAQELSTGLGLHLAPGLMYAGLAGATRWPSGTRSKNTLAQRIIRMHLGGNRRGSTLRRTLAAILSETHTDRQVDEQTLTRWMNQHLTVIARRVEDPDTLGQLEARLLARLDPPLNLKEVPPSPIRVRLRDLRSRHNPQPAATVSMPTPADPLHFGRAMAEVYERARAEAGYNATQYLQMLAALGPLETARRLLHSPQISDGFAALWERGRLDLTVESLVLQHEFADFFTDEEREIAQQRLADYGHQA